MRKRFISAIAAIILSSCVSVTPITPEMMAHADFGPYPKNYRSIVERFFEPQLIDPTSPLYTFTPPKKMGVDGVQEAPKFGWRVCGTINSKNRMGGYSGRANFYILIRNGEVIDSMLGDPTQNNAMHEGFIASNCNR